MLSALALLLVNAAPASDEPTPRPAPVEARPHRPFDSDSPMAEGWPDGTPPGKVEVKPYPAYRSAVSRAREAPMGADNVLFFPLFNHISRKNIAMTTPVVNTYTPAMIETPGVQGEMTMEFIYRTPTMGETGRDRGTVEVVDHPAATYVCLGLQGRMGAERLREGVKTLKGWLAEHGDEWVEAGPPRRLGYHGPQTPEAERLWEVQIPIKPAAPKGEDGPK